MTTIQNDPFVYWRMLTCYGQGVDIGPLTEFWRARGANESNWKVKQWNTTMMAISGEVGTARRASPLKGLFCSVKLPIVQSLSRS